MERIFIDKVFALEFYYRRGKYMDVAKHAYDLAVLLGNAKIRALLNDQRSLQTLMTYERREQSVRLGGIEETCQVGDFSVFRGFAEEPQSSEAFERMQRIYVPESSDWLKLEEVVGCLEEIKLIFQ